MTAKVILATWGLLLAIYALGRGRVREQAPAALMIDLPEADQAQAPPGTQASRAATLWAFLTNIATISLILSGRRAAAQRKAVQVRLPVSVRVVGGCLFVATQV